MQARNALAIALGYHAPRWSAFLDRTNVYFFVDHLDRPSHAPRHHPTARPSMLCCLRFCPIAKDRTARIARHHEAGDIFGRNFNAEYSIAASIVVISLPLRNRATFCPRQVKSLACSASIVTHA
jgi:hypothetical protein